MTKVGHTRHEELQDRDLIAYWKGTTSGRISANLAIRHAPFIEWEGARIINALFTNPPPIIDTGILFAGLVYFPALFRNGKTTLAFDQLTRLLEFLSSFVERSNSHVSKVSDSDHNSCPINQVSTFCDRFLVILLSFISSFDASRPHERERLIDYMLSLDQISLVLAWRGALAIRGNVSPSHRSNLLKSRPAAISANLFGLVTIYDELIELAAQER
jgi:hypothetical protein